MALIEKLAKILSEPGLLPDDPTSAVKGPELLARVRRALDGEYSDASIRQTFSALAGDSTSPLARVEQGYGYYRRPTVGSPSATIPRSQQSGPLAQASLQQVDNATRREEQLEEKFRAFYMRYVQLDAGFPVHVEHVHAARQQSGVNRWKFPDVVVLNWAVIEQRDFAFHLDKDILEVKRSLGEQPFRLTSAELKVSVSFSSFRENFFQCVSNSRWAHTAHLVVATPISDSLLASELRRLGTSYGVAISHFDFTESQLTALPAADRIIAMEDTTFESLASNHRATQLGAGTSRSDLDWEHLRDMRAQSEEFRDLFEWVARCLRDGKAYPFRRFQDLRSIERGSS